VKSRISDLASGCAKSATLPDNSFRTALRVGGLNPAGHVLTAHFECQPTPYLCQKGWALRASLRRLGPADSSATALIAMRIGVSIAQPLPSTHLIDTGGNDNSAALRRAGYNWFC
jgi:hypothetical protein